MPSSRFLVRRVLRKIDFTKDQQILQLGFGTGVFAHAILDAMTPGSTLTVFEVDERSRQYAIEDPRLRYVEDSAERISAHCGAQLFDTVVSTLPLASIPTAVTQGILEQVRTHLKLGGAFFQYQYSLLSRSDMRGLFGTEPRIDFELLNVPPAFIYEVRRPF